MPERHILIDLARQTKEGKEEEREEQKSVLRLLLDEQTGIGWVHVLAGGLAAFHGEFPALCAAAQLPLPRSLQVELTNCMPTAVTDYLYIGSAGNSANFDERTCGTSTCRATCPSTPALLPLPQARGQVPHRGPQRGGRGRLL